jgi:hypothetical protein
VTNKTFTWSTITLTNTSTFSGTLIDTINPILPVPPCYIGISAINASLNNPRINGCDCCHVSFVQPVITKA